MQTRKLAFVSYMCILQQDVFVCSVCVREPFIHTETPRYMLLTLIRKYLGLNAPTCDAHHTAFLAFL